ncbi:hypothetical protein V6N12_032003 [Hibiscus sabdariffa]|uniref:Uncharacterized protein n=1 Tax=Hibiscus sabdariffa TaxID=183260 RepID=A0ABR2BYT1_9ROSI
MQVPEKSVDESAAISLEAEESVVVPEIPAEIRSDDRDSEEISELATASSECLTFPYEEPAVSTDSVVPTVARTDSVEHAIGMGLGLLD